MTLPDARVLPPDVVVELRGIGSARHVLLSIEGTTFELRPADASAIGIALEEEAKKLTEALS